MTPLPQRARVAGFTLIEVVVAMFVIAIGVGALLNTLSVSANNIGRLRNKSFAEWIALNRISEVRLERSRPSPGVTSGEIEYAGTKWRWRQEIIDQDIAGMLRIDVAVALASDAASPGESAEDFPAITTAYGFIGTSVGSPSGLMPAWSLPPPRGPGRP